MTVELRDELTAAGIEQLHALYGAEWWTSERTLPDVAEMVENTDELVVLWDVATDELVAFARVLTDYVYKALIFDMIVAEPRRGRGYGRRVMERILEHPDLHDVERFELYCRGEMVPFYEQWGFTDDTGGSRLMRRG
jgi:predicted GNAT family N-acyltransferase